MKRKSVLKLLSIGITFILVVILLSQISIHDLIAILVSIEPQFLIASFSLYLCTYIFRAIRFSLLLDNTISTKELFPIMCVHTLMNAILPARTGELSYVYLIKKIHGKKAGEGIATLIVARVLDFIIIIILLFISGFLIEEIPMMIQNYIWFIYLILFSLLGLLLSLIIYGHNMVRLCKKILEKLRLTEQKYGNYILMKGGETADSFEQMSFRKNLIKIVFLTFSVWLFSFGSLYTILLGMKIMMPIQIVIFGATFILLATVLPIHGIGGFGTTEAIWTLVYVPLGMTTNEAILSGFGYHILTLVFTMILWLSGFVLLKKNQNHLL